MSDQATEPRDPDEELGHSDPAGDAGPSGENGAGGPPDADALARREAALAAVIKFGDPVLRSKASKVTDFDATLAEEAERMAGLMNDAMGVGLAATQLGVLRRMLVYRAGHDAPVTTLVNPELEWVSEDDQVTAEEGCLSLPGVIVDVERPLYVRVAAVDVAGAAVTVEASGLEARVIQHEMDHLDGVLTLQRTTREQRKAAMRALREGGTYAPPQAEDDLPEGDSHDSEALSSESAGGDEPL